MRGESVAPPIPNCRSLSLLVERSACTLWAADSDIHGGAVTVTVYHRPLDEAAGRRFDAAVRTATALGRHPHLVTVYDSGRLADGRAYIVSDGHERATAEGLLLTSGVLDVERVLRMGIALAGALETAHRAGVVHGGVSPALVLLGADGQPVLTEVALTEFGQPAGISAFLDHSIPYHAPPEVLESTELSPATDVYSLASVIYTLLVGDPPHASDGVVDSTASLLLRILQMPMPSIQRSDVPPGLEDTLRGALAHVPGKRPQQVLELAWAFQDAQRVAGMEATEPIVLDPAGAGGSPAAVTVAGPAGLAAPGLGSGTGAIAVAGAGAPSGPGAGPAAPAAPAAGDGAGAGLGLPALDPLPPGLDGASTAITAGAGTGLAGGPGGPGGDASPPERPLAALDADPLRADPLGPDTGPDVRPGSPGADLRAGVGPDVRPGSPGADLGAGVGPDVRPGSPGADLGTGVGPDVRTGWASNDVGTGIGEDLRGAGHGPDLGTGIGNDLRTGGASNDVGTGMGNDLRGTGPGPDLGGGTGNDLLAGRPGTDLGAGMSPDRQHGGSGADLGGIGNDPWASGPATGVGDAGGLPSRRARGGEVVGRELGDGPPGAGWPGGEPGQGGRGGPEDVLSMPGADGFGRLTPWAPSSAPPSDDELGLNGHRSTAAHGPEARHHGTNGTHRPHGDPAATGPGTPAGPATPGPGETTAGAGQGAAGERPWWTMFGTTAPPDAPAARSSATPAGAPAGATEPVADPTLDPPLVRPVETPAAAAARARSPQVSTRAPVHGERVTALERARQARLERQRQADGDGATKGPSAAPALAPAETPAEPGRVGPPALPVIVLVAVVVLLGLGGAYLVITGEDSPEGRAQQLRATTTTGPTTTTGTGFGNLRAVETNDGGVQLDWDGPEAAYTVRVLAADAAPRALPGGPATALMVPKPLLTSAGGMCFEVTASTTGSTAASPTTAAPGGSTTTAATGAPTSGAAPASTATTATPSSESGDAPIDCIRGATPATVRRQ